MKKFSLVLLMCTLMTGILFAGGKQAAGSGDLVKAAWFSDVAGWNPPLTWNLDENTVTGYMTKQTGVQFEMNIPPEDGSAKLALMLVSGKLPDVMTLTDGDMIKELIDAGKVWKLEELLKTHDPGSHLLTDFPADMKEALKYKDGDWYSFPSHQDSPDARKVIPPVPFYEDYFNYSVNVALMWDNDVLARVGLNKADLQTEEQVLAAWRKVKASGATAANGQPIIPVMLNPNYQYNPLIFLYMSFGAEEVDRNGVYHDRILTPQAKHALKFFNTLYREGIIDAAQLTIDEAQQRSLFASGRVLSFMGDPGGMGAEKTHGNYWSAGPIVSSDGARPILSKSLRAGTGWMQTLISKDTRNPAVLAKWLSYMSGRDGMFLAEYGLEGRDYTIGAGNVVQVTPAGEQNKIDTTKTGVFAYWPFHNSAFEYGTRPSPAAGSADANYVQVTSALGKYKDTAIYDGGLLNQPSGFIDPNSDIGIIQLQITNFKEAQISTLITASSDAIFEREYNTLITQLKSLGIDKLDAKINEAVQANYRRFGARIQKVNP
ncbi:hypothetical protein FACS1894109_01770 [Spirochaetia bacterium]|nr:hypothetical protein FACS1894109_01770 [Spirochaetia bacterium]